MKFLIKYGLYAMILWVSQVMANENYILAFNISNVNFKGVLFKQLADQSAYSIIYQKATSSNKDPLFAFDPPTLYFNDSPMKHFNYWMDLLHKHQTEEQPLISDENANLKIYIAAAGTETLGFKPNISLFTEFKTPFNEHCFSQFAETKIDFFTCVFKARIQHEFHLPAANISFLIENDEEFNSSVVMSHLNKNPEIFAKPWIKEKEKEDKCTARQVGISHWTTFMHPYCCFPYGQLDTNNCCFDKSGGIYQMGQLFQQLHVINFMQNGEVVKLLKTSTADRNDDLSKLLERDAEEFPLINQITKHETLLGVCKEQEKDTLDLFARLIAGKGFNLFGDMLLEPSGIINPHALSQSNDIFKQIMKNNLLKLMNWYFLSRPQNLKKVELISQGNRYNFVEITAKSSPILYFIGDMFEAFENYCLHYLNSSIPDYLFNMSLELLEASGDELFVQYQDKLLSDYNINNRDELINHIRKYFLPLIKNATFIREKDILTLLPEVILEKQFAS